MPTPPPWWQYAKRQVINERAVEDFPTVEDEILQRLFIKRVPEWTTLPIVRYAMLVQVAQLPPSVRYLSERQYEAYHIGALMRDAVFQGSRKSTDALNNFYEFDFQPFVGDRARADRAYIIRVTARSRTSQVLPPPGPGTRVTISVHFANDPVPTDFIGRVIATPPGDNEYGIAMVVSRKGGRCGFVFTGHGK